MAVDKRSLSPLIWQGSVTGPQIRNLWWLNHVAYAETVLSSPITVYSSSQLHKQSLVRTLTQLSIDTVSLTFIPSTTSRTLDYTLSPYLRLTNLLLTLPSPCPMLSFFERLSELLLNDEEHSPVRLSNSGSVHVLRVLWNHERLTQDR